MKRLFLSCCLCFVLVLPALARADSAQFLSVIDGDSLMVRLDHRPVEIRLIGIDAPEWDQEYGLQAKTFAMRFCYGKQLRLEYDKERKDRYGRVLAYVYDGATMLNEELVKNGLAVPILVKPNGRYYLKLKKAEKIAKAERRGFWLRGGLSMTPGQWRKKQNKS